MRAAIRVRVVAAAALGCVLVLDFGFAGSARAFDDFEGTRAVGMGSATRAWALGDSAVLLNPAGMSLAKAYNVEASYAYGSRLSEQFLHAAVVDSTSDTTLAGGLYYTYHIAHSPPAAVAGHAHEAGFALSLPFGTAVTAGGTLKWFRLEGSDDGPAVLNPATSRDAVTFDLGATVRPMPTLVIACAGQNLRDLDAPQVTPLIGYGVAYLPLPELVVDVDGVTRLRSGPGASTGVRAGVEGTVAQRVTIRGGGGTDPNVGAGYLAAGVSILSEVAAVDVGVRGDLFPYRTGTTRDIFVGLSLRLFVAGAVASTAPLSQ